MSLSCSCDYDDFAWYYRAADDYSTLSTKRRRRCSSCQSLIDIGATVMEFTRTREALSDIEEKIYGSGNDAVNLASWYMCEECADLYFSLCDLGFDCVSLDDNMHDVVREYHETYGRPG